MTNFGRNFVFLWKINCLALFNVFIFLFFYKCPVGTSAYQKLLLLNKCPRALNRSKIRSILKNCVELLIKHSCRGLFLIKLYRPLPETLLETDCLPVSLKKPSRAVFFFFFFFWTQNESICWNKERKTWKSDTHTKMKLFVKIVNG